MVTNLVRHRDLAHRENDGAVQCSSRCVQSHDVSSKVKVRERSLTLNGWVISTKEAINLAFNITQTRTTISCMFVPYKGTQEESWERIQGIR